MSDLRTPGAILLVACYELGHQPLNLASPLALLRQAGYDPAAIDTSVSALPNEALTQARVLAISVPMHTALRLGVRVAERARSLNPTITICFYGLYATLNAEYLLRDHADALIGGEYEEALLALVQSVEQGASLVEVPVVTTGMATAAPVLRRLPLPPPARETLPALENYARLATGDETRLAGYVEASRGCLHTCRHCPITPVYHGRFFVLPRETVLADIRAQVAAGARHITFGDPDFMNGPKRSLDLARELHDEFPDVTFDATIKVEHILERRGYFPELAALGCAFVVSAIESLSEDVLRHLTKGHTRADVVEALSILAEAGIPMRPTFVAFTPWTTARDYLELLDFVEEYDLIEAVDAIQFAIRLLVPPGSALLSDPNAHGWVGPLDEAAFSYTWTHRDPRMDALQGEVMALVERAVAEGRSSRATFYALRALAEERLASDLGPTRRRRRLPVLTAGRPTPHLTEAWFCCAEPSLSQLGLDGLDTSPTDVR
jgi:radical SAM superfamily enzyme YgiQ (UPF0313 family)